MTGLPQPAPGTAGLYDLLLADRASLIGEREQHAKSAERMRAMLLCWVDDLEREIGYGQNGQPRTAQIRQYWRECGQPELGKNGKADQ